MSRSYRLALAALCGLLGWLAAPQAQAQLNQAAAQRILNRLGATQDTVALNGLYGNMEPATQIAPSLLGVGAQSVSTPGGLQDVSLSVLQSFATFPAQGSGVGIEFSPVQLWEKTSYRPTLFDTLLARQLGMRPLRLDTVAYRSLAEYRRTFWRRGFVLSGASVNDSTAARLAVGLSYTFGAGQLDPFKAAGYAEALTQELQNQLLSQGSVANMQRVMKRYYTQRAALIDTAVAAAGIKPSQFSSVLAYGDFLSYFTDNVLGLPQSQLGDSLTQFKQATDTARIHRMLTTYLGTVAVLAPAQRATLARVLLLRTTVYREAVGSYQQAARPVLRTAGAVLKATNQEFERRQWNAPLLQVGGGQVWRSPDHTWNGLRGQSAHVFVRGSLRAPAGAPWLARHAQLVGNLQLVGSATDSVRRQALTGLRLLVGNERLRFSIEGSLRFQAYRAYDGAAARPDNTINRLTVGVETRLADNLWLEVAFGRTNATATTQPSDRAGLLTLADLKYGFRSKRRFNVP